MDTRTDAEDLLDNIGWRHAVLAVVVLSPLVGLLSLDPMPQDVAYHRFADTRRFFGIPNFFDVVSNLPFLLVGTVGARFCLKHDLGPARGAWLVLFVGVSLVSLGSAYYHWNPGNETLVWDRLPMTVGFMGLLAALLGEYVSSRLTSKLLVPLIILGIGSVLYWHWFDDLRPYVWVQFVPLLMLPFVLVLFSSRHTHQWLLIVALVWYVLAKVAEVFDAAMFQATGGVVSGHTIKHLLAAIGCYSILVMLQKRGPMPEPSRKKYRSGLRWIWLGLAVIAALVVAAHVLLHAFVDADYLESRLTDALAAPSDSLYRVEVEDVEFSLLREYLLVENVALQPDPVVLRQRSKAGKLPATRYRLTIPMLRLDGVNLWRLLWKQDIALGALRLQEPHLYIEMGNAEKQAEASGADSQDQAGAGAPGGSFHAAIARHLPHIYLDHLHVDQGSVSFSRTRGEQNVTLPGISAQLRSVVIDSVSARDEHRVLFSDDVQVQIAPYRRFSSDSLYVFEMGPLQGSSREASLRVASLRLEPTVSDKVFMRRHDYRTHRYKISTGPVAITEVGYRRLIEQREGLVGLLHVDSLLIDIYYDKTLPLPPTASPKLPHEAFQEIEVLLRLDTVRVTHGEIRYSERAADGVRPGTLTFEETWGTIYNVTNDPHRRMSPAVLEGRSLLAGAGGLDARIQYWLLAPSLSMTYRGTLGHMDARALNRMLVDVEGIKIERGQIDSLWFDVKVDREVASGALQAVYHDLKIETRDKATHEHRLKHRIETLLANEMKLRSENVAEGDNPPRIAIIRHERTAEDPLIRFIWESLREGLFSTIGL